MGATSLVRWAVLAAVVAGLAGCDGVGRGGQVGVGVDPAGRPVAVLAVCRGHLDGITLYYRDGPRPADLGSWAAPAPLVADEQVPLAAPPRGWTTRRPLVPRLHDDVVYDLFGWAADDSWVSGTMSFTSGQLAHLRPGEVLYRAWDARTETLSTRVGTPAEFHGDSCGAVDGGRAG